MVADRLDVRLDRERRRKLAELAETKGASVSEVVRSMIDREYEAAQRDKRVQAARKLAMLQVEDVPEPDVLSRQLEATHVPSDLH